MVAISYCAGSRGTCFKESLDSLGFCEYPPNEWYQHYFEVMSGKTFDDFRGDQFPNGKPTVAGKGHGNSKKVLRNYKKALTDCFSLHWRLTAHQ